MKPYNDYIEKIRCFNTITITPVYFDESSAKIKIDADGKQYIIRYRYNRPVYMDENIAGLMGLFPVINYGIFTERIVMDFPVNKNQIEYIQKFLKINNREVFVNRLCSKRWRFFKDEFVPAEQEITEENSYGRTELEFRIIRDDIYKMKGSGESVVMLSGGKESLMTFGLLSEIQENTEAFFFNESGGHWKIAKPSYDVINETGKAIKVWSDLDRFYNRMNRSIAILNEKVAFSWADDYPVQLFIFPVYLVSLIPAIMKYGYSHIWMGNEMDDPFEISAFKNLKHYAGVYDQSVDFQQDFSGFLKSMGIECDLNSAVYNIYGCLIEKILVKRYHHLYLLQRSCHSCHYEDGKIIPCGKCSKCVGVRLFLNYAGADESEIYYPPPSEIRSLIGNSKIRLDPDEVSFLLSVLDGYVPQDSHVDGIHILPDETIPFQRIPEELRERIFNIISSYASGIYMHLENHWKKLTEGHTPLQLQ